MLARDLEGAITKALGMEPLVVVLTCDLIARAIEANPFPDEPDPKRLHAVFFAARPGPDDSSPAAGATRAAEFVEAAEAAAAARGGRDQARYVHDVLYLHTPDGLSNSELAAQLSRAGGPLTSTGGGTARNWATATRLLRLCGE